MVTPHWQLKNPISAVVFDCDGTLSTIEGIDELATQNGVGKKVKALTAKAMGVSGMTPELYHQRLKLVNPRLEQVEALGHTYFIHRIPDLHAVIAILQRLQKSIYIVSAGLSPAVRIFAQSLQIPDKNIFAVDIRFDDQGNFFDFDVHSPLVHPKGKRHIVSELKRIHPELIHIGDGLNDLDTYDLVSRFIGFGGAFYRENIANLCDYYINTLAFAPLLPLSLTEAEFQLLSKEEQTLFQQGVQLILNGKVLTKR